MNVVLLCLFLFCACLMTGDAIRCYKCNACESTSAQKETCRNVDPQTEEVGCLTQRVSVRGSNMILKKCVVYEKYKHYNCTSLPDSAPLSCDVCLGDLCNSAPSSIKNPFVFISFLILTYKILV